MQHLPDDGEIYISCDMRSGLTVVFKEGGRTGEEAYYTRFIGIRTISEAEYEDGV